MRPAPASTASRSSSAWRKFITLSNVARQSAMTPVFSTNQRSDCCTWLKAPTTIISSPKLNRPAK